MTNTLSEKDYDFIIRLVYEHSRINLGEGKRELVTARLGKRLRSLKLNTYGEYCDLLRTPQGEEELVNLIDSISTNHTFFFREIKHFEFLEQEIIPKFCTREQGGGTFRVWSAASSSGEEPYSIAILLSEYFANKPTWQWEVQATDISTKILAKARDGVFAEDRLREVKPDLLRKYFQKGIGKWEGHFRMKEFVRQKVHFHHLNLLQPTYPFQHAFPIIFCRNVMIYFDRPTQEQLVKKLTDLLLPGGYLLVGHSESLTGIKHSLKAVKPAIYMKPA
jgi:chemotaxis protein methyltransferase CheR